MNARNALLPTGLLLSFLPLLGCSGGPGDPAAARRDPFSTSPVTSLVTEDRACVETVADYCSFTSCYSDWTTADDACMNGTGSLQYSTTCGSSLYALSQGSTTSYYTASNNALLAVVGADGKCIAGPANFAPPAASSCPLVTCGMFSCGGGPDAGAP
jgi:hypothetical protein